MSIFLSRLLRPVLLAALAAALLPGAAAAQSKPPTTHVSKVTVKGGNKVRDAEDGVIFRQPAACSTFVPRPFVKPIAASLGQEVKLEVELISCPAGEQTAGTRCHATIGGGPAADLAVPLPLPKSTGIHAVRLVCDDAAEEIATRLFLTYASPRPMVDPPAPDWYEKACEWGEGLTLENTEQQVADQILQGLFLRGQRRWRYGRCKKIDEERCDLSDGTRVNPAGLRCNTTIDTCKLDWSELVRTDIDRRNFSDCFEFSSAFEYIAATMGVGGMVDEEIKAPPFLTRAETRSFDTAFGGNLLCGERKQGCAFLFYNHSLRRRGGRIYDATFGGLYRSPGELIFQRAEDWNDTTLFFKKSRACKGPWGYGNFTSYREMPRNQGPPCSPEGSGAKFDPREIKVFPLSIDEDRVPEVLAVDLKVVVERKGSYSVQGEIRCRDGTVVSVRPERGLEVLSTAAVSGPPGTHPARLIFSGSDVRSSAGPDCAPRLRAYLTTADLKTADELPAAEIQLGDLSTLDDRAAILGPADKLELAWVTPEPTLRATLPVEVRRPGDFAVEARLAWREETLAYGGYRRKLGRETEKLEVDFPLPIGPSPEGDLEISVALHRLDPLRQLTPIEPVHSLLIPKVKLPPP